MCFEIRSNEWKLTIYLDLGICCLFTIYFITKKVFEMQTRISVYKLYTKARHYTFNIQVFFTKNSMPLKIQLFVISQVPVKVRCHYDSPRQVPCLRTQNKKGTYLACLHLLTRNKTPLLLTDITQYFQVEYIVLLPDFFFLHKYKFF